MGEIPGDPSARQAWLERWAAEQQADRQGAQNASLRRRLVQVARGELPIARALEDYAEHFFDRRLDTHGTADPEIYTAGSQVYAPSMWHVLPRALRAVGASEHDVLVDFGCGKGRVVHQAARWPLKRVIGVEMSPKLADFAQTLVSAHRHEYRCQSVEIVPSDVTSFRVPDDLTIAYLFDPFRGPTLDAVLRNLITSIDSHARRIWLIYVHPVEGGQVLATGRFRLVKWQRGGLRDYRLSRAAIFESRR